MYHDINTDDGSVHPALRPKHHIKDGGVYGEAGIERGAS